MSEQLAMVTGAAGAIGGGVAVMLRSKGYRIIAVDIDDAAAARAVEVIGGDTIGVACDVRDRASAANGRTGWRCWSATPV